MREIFDLPIPVTPQYPHNWLNESNHEDVDYRKSYFNIGIYSYHTSIQTTFKITAIKFKVNERIVTQIDWKIIGYHKTTN